MGLPLARALEEVPNPLVLDVGTGTARLARALLFQPHFRGRVVGVDLSRRMLEHGVRLTRPHAGRVTFIWQDAQALPFQDGTFDAVTCLEMIEFTPHPQAVLAELVRVLRPGGVLLVTNRVGRDARFLPRRTFSHRAFLSILQNLGLDEVQTRTWQVDYDLHWAVKGGAARGGGVRPLAQVLRCPACSHDGLELREGAYTCPACGRAYPVADDGVIEMARVATKRAPNHSPQQARQLL